MRFLRCWMSTTVLMLTIVAAKETARSQDAMASTPVIPATQADSLLGRHLTLPQDAPGSVTVLILGFGRHSADATTAWEKPVRTGLQNAGAPGSTTAVAAHTIGFFDLAMLADVPGFMRGIVTRAIRGKVPDPLKPNFLVLTGDEDAWKRVAGYDPHEPDAAYVMVIDHGGHVRWSTHAPFNPTHFMELAQQAQRLAQDAR